LWLLQPSKPRQHEVIEHEKTCSHNQHAFIPFTLDTFGFLALEVVDLQRVQGVIHNKIMSHRSKDIVFKMIDFVIQKRLVT